MEISLINVIFAFSLVITITVLIKFISLYYKDENKYKRLQKNLQKGKLSINELDYFFSNLYKGRYILDVSGSFPFIKENEHAKITLLSYHSSILKGELTLKKNDKKLSFTLDYEGNFTVFIDSDSKTYKNYSFLNLSYIAYLFDAMNEIDLKIIEEKNRIRQKEREKEAKFEDFDKEANTTRLAFKKAEERDKAFSLLKDDPEAMTIFYQMVAESETLKKVRIKEKVI